MNEEALQDAYRLFSNGGYSGSLEEFKVLIDSNPEALNDSYKLFRGGGYSGDFKAYKTLIGQKKKEEITEELSDSTSEDSLLDSQFSITESKATKGVNKALDAATDVAIDAIMPGFGLLKTIITNPKNNSKIFDIVSEPGVSSEVKEKKETTEEPKFVDPTILSKSFEEDAGVNVETDETKLNMVQDLYSGMSGLNLDELSRYLDSDVEYEGVKSKRNRIIDQALAGTIDSDAKLESLQEDFKDLSDAGIYADMKRQEALSVYTKDKVNYINKKIQAIDSLMAEGKEDYEGLNLLDTKQNLINERTSLVKSVNRFSRQYLPFFNKYMQDKKQDLANKYVSGDMGLYNMGDITSGIGTGLSKFEQGAGKAVNDVTSVVFDAIGLDNVADRIRKNSEMEELKKLDPSSFMIARGKVVNHEGKKYIVTPEGQIIDEEREVDVSFFGEQAGIDLGAIRNKAKESNELETTSSFYGMMTGSSNVLGNLAVQIIGMKGSGKVLKAGGKYVTKPLTGLALGKQSTMRANAMLSTGAIVYSGTYNQTYQEALDLGLNDAQAQVLADDIADVTGIVGGLTAVLISPNIGGQKLLDKISVKEMTKRVVEGKTTNTRKQIALDFIKGALPEGTLEAVQENLELVGEDYARKKANLKLGDEIFKPVLTTNSVLNNSAAAFATAGLLGGAGNVGKSKIVLYNRLGSSQELFQKYMKMYVNQDRISQPEADRIVKEVESYHQFKNSVPSNIRNKPEAIEITNLLAQKNQLKDKLKTQDEVFHEGINKEISEIDAQIQTLTNQSTSTTKEPEVEPKTTEQDASTKPSAVAQTSPDESTTTEEVVEGVSSEVQQPTGTSQTQTDSDVDTTTQEEITPEDELTAEVEAVTEQEAEQELDELLSEAEAKNENVTTVGTQGRNKSISRKASAQTKAQGFNTRTPEGKRRFNKIKSKITQDFNKKMRTLKRAANLLGKILPNTKIVLAETKADYDRLRGEKSNSVGVFRVTKDGRTAIFVDVSALSTDKGIETIAHELFHAILYKKFGKNKAKIRRVTDKMVKELQKTLQNSNDKDLQDMGNALVRFSKQYPEAKQTEEFLSETLGYLAERFDQVRRDSKALKIVVSFVNKISDLLGIGKVKKELAKDPDRVLRALALVAKKLQSGEVLQDTDFDIINEIETEVDQEGVDAPIVTGAVDFVGDTDTTTDEEVTVTVLEDVEVDETTTEDRVVEKKKKPTTTDATSTTLLRKISTEIKKAIKQAKNQQKKIKREVALAIRESVKQGTLSAKQALVLAKRALTLNVDSPLAVERFILYTKKAFADANSIFKLKTANTFRKQLKKIGNSKTIDAAIAASAKNFALMDPIYVEDLDLYNQLAKELVDGSKSSRVLKGEVKQKRTADLAKINAFADNQLEKEKVEIEATMRDEFEAMTGIDAKDMTYAQMKSYLDDKTPAPSEQDESIIRKAVTTMFNKYSETIKQMLSSGVDAATGNPLDLSANQKSIVKEFMDMDLSVMGIKEVIRSVDALNNFIVNRNTGGMETVVNNNKGASNVSKMVRDGKIVKPKTKFKFLFENLVNPVARDFASLTIYLKSLLGGLDNSIDFKMMSGLVFFDQGASLAKKLTEEITDNYAKKFSKLRPNNELFNSVKNTLERGVYAFLVRTTSGDIDSSNKEFKRRLRLVKQSIEKYRRGDKKQQETADVLQEIYDKIKGAENSLEIENVFDQVNKDAVLFWQNEWARIYPQLSETSYNIYNQILGNDVNYTPDKFSAFEADTEVELDNQSAFASFSGTVFGKKKAGVLFESTKPQQLPKDRVVNFNFDSNMARSMESAQMDVQTAQAFNQVKGFVESPDFKKLIPDNTIREITAERIINYINKTKKNVYIPKKQQGFIDKSLDFLANLGVSRALSGLAQPFKQTIPMMFDILITSGGKLDLASYTNKSIQNWINKSGASVALRGGLSTADMSKLESFINSDEIIEQAKDLKNLPKIIKRINDIGLKYLLVKPDQMIARVAFITYYKQKLSEKGVNVESINWETHKPDKEAVAYADAQVDIQQNISNPEMFGRFFEPGDGLLKRARQLFMPFASHAMNLKLRIYTDMLTLISNTASAAEKRRSITSLIGASTQLAAFHTMSYFIASSLMSIGADDDEKTRKKRLSNIKKGRLGNLVSDFLSPINQNYVNDVTLSAINVFYRNITGDDKELFFGISDRETFLEKFGQIGIPIKKFKELIDISFLAYGDGVYEDSYGNKRKISKKQQDNLKFVVIPSIFYNLGLLPAETGTYIRNSVREAKKKTTKAK